MAVKISTYDISYVQVNQSILIMQATYEIGMLSATRTSLLHMYWLLLSDPVQNSLHAL